MNDDKPLIEELAPIWQRATVPEKIEIIIWIPILSGAAILGGVAGAMVGIFEKYKKLLKEGNT